MTVLRRFGLSAVLACAVALVPAPVAPALAEQDLSVGDYRHVSSRRITPTVVEHTYRARLIPGGPAGRSMCSE